MTASDWPVEAVTDCPWGYNERCPRAGTCRDKDKPVSHFARCFCLVPVADGQSGAAEPAEQGPGTTDPIVAERNAFKEKLKSINFGRVPGGARD